jgi:hypothetical protein
MTNQVTQEEIEAAKSVVEGSVERAFKKQKTQ